MNDLSTNVIVADLESKFTQIEREPSDNLFYIKIADYGKYLLDHRLTTELINQLYRDAKQDELPYITAWNKFYNEWKKLVEDIIEKAKQGNITDSPKDPFSNNIVSLKNRLKEPNVTLWDTTLGDYYRPYQLLVSQFNKFNKSYLLIPLHIKDAQSQLELHTTFKEAKREWEKFERLREIRVWWAHYQISRLTAGVMNLTDFARYFQEDNAIDCLYKFEFERIAKGESATVVLLHKKKYEEWIKRLHEYLIPRLKNQQENSTYNLIPSERLKYYSENGLATFKGIDYYFKGKARALLTVLNISKNTPFTVEDVKQNCNAKIYVEKYKFRAYRDIDDTIRYIKNMLRVKRGEYFPIQKDGNNIIWEVR